MTAAARMRIYGLPAPQGSKRHIGGGRMVEASRKVGPWREAVVSEAQRLGYAGLRFDEPLAVRITFYLPRPVSHRGARGLRPSAPVWPAKVPDLDKLVRSTLDGLVQAAVMSDDARVVIVHARKTYDDEQAAGALIHITGITAITEETP